MDIDRLIDAGLTKNQARVYLHLVKNPGHTAGETAKSLSIDRSFSYGIINSLISKGLVSYSIKEKKKMFFPSDPENLLKEIDDKREKILGTIKEIKSLEHDKNDDLTVKIYEGKAGVKAYVRDLLDSPEFFTLGGGGKLNILETLKYEYPHYLKEFKKKKMKGKLITSQKNREIMQKVYENAEIGIKSFDNLKSKVNFIILKNKLTIYIAKEKPSVIVIENSDTATALKDYFDILWKVAK